MMRKRFLSWRGTALYFREWVTTVGSIRIDSPGLHELVLKAKEIDKSVPEGLRISSVHLVRKQ
ncbi:hypothetical protein HQ520_15475 [bacterium]|nr:hypothetical protein [bacterium]